MMLVTQSEDSQNLTLVFINLNISSAFLSRGGLYVRPTGKQDSTDPLTLRDY